MFKIFRVSIENFEVWLSQTVDFLFSLSTPFFSLLSLSLADSPLSARAGVQARRACARCRAAPLPAPARCPAAWPRVADAPPHLSAHAVLAAPCPLTSARRRAASPPWHPTGRPCTCRPHATPPSSPRPRCVAAPLLPCRLATPTRLKRARRAPRPPSPPTPCFPRAGA